MSPNEFYVLLIIYKYGQININEINIHILIPLPNIKTILYSLQNTNKLIKNINYSNEGDDSFIITESGKNKLLNYFIESPVIISHLPNYIKL